jgi:hypothetical protein
MQRDADAADPRSGDAAGLEISGKGGYRPRMRRASLSRASGGQGFAR